MSLPPKRSPAAVMQAKRRAIVQNPFALLLHNWRLRRVRWAFATLNRQLDVYERAYGPGLIRLTDEDLKAAGLCRSGD